jgi:hypothetical protein
LNGSLINHFPLLNWLFLFLGLVHVIYLILLQYFIDGTMGVHQILFVLIFTWLHFDLFGSTFLYQLAFLDLVSNFFPFFSLLGFDN